MSVGTFSKLRVKELAPVEELTKPDFIINPHLYFGKMWDSFSPTPPPLLVTGESRRYTQLTFHLLNLHFNLYLQQQQQHNS